MKRRRIDFSDIPELSEKQLSVMRRVGRPPLGEHPRRLISIRLDSNVLNWVKKTAAKKRLPYQSLINEALLAHIHQRS
ncbi:MAG: BrnA antitoxin family protein, partial [Candidatus Binatota bacterium]